METETTNLSSSERDFLRQAKLFLERPTYVIRLANALGKPLEGAVALLPESKKELIQEAVQKALSKGLDVVRASVPRREGKMFEEAERGSRNVGRWHSIAAFGAGAGGGFFGLATLPIELPVTTAIMLRSIASIAAEFGMDLEDPQVQLECLYVLSLGSDKSDQDDAMDSAYWTSRVAFARLIKDASREIQQKVAPVLARFLAQVASRYNVVVSQKALAIMVPAVGAVGGGAINAAFSDYFSDAARYHFGLRALEKRYGPELVRHTYETL